jgi:hypothetical protein
MAKSKKAYKLDPRNARKHPERNKQAVESSLSELGAGRSIVVDADGFVIGGNAVYEQALRLKIPIREIETSGDELVVVRRVDLHTDDPKRKALALADNQIATMAEWDEVVLEDIKAELLDEIDLDVMGFWSIDVVDNSALDDDRGGRTAPGKSMMVISIGTLSALIEYELVQSIMEKMRKKWPGDDESVLRGFCEWFLS